MARGIGWLAKDLKREIEKARAEAGPKIVVALKEQGPWWTGTFGRNWELSSQPLKPTKEREGGIDDRTARNTSPPAALKLPLNSPLYIGNTVEYAGFAINNPLAKKGGVTYEEHGQKFKLTARGQNPDWFKVYTETNEILGDITDVFVAAGFKRAV